MLLLPLFRLLRENGFHRQKSICYGPPRPKHRSVLSLVSPLLGPVICLACISTGSTQTNRRPRTNIKAVLESIVPHHHTPSCTGFFRGAMSNTQQSGDCHCQQRRQGDRSPHQTVIQRLVVLFARIISRSAKFHLPQVVIFNLRDSIKKSPGMKPYRPRRCGLSSIMSNVERPETTSSRWGKVCVY
jgi:hypothetical protein